MNTKKKRISRIPPKENLWRIIFRNGAEMLPNALPPRPDDAAHVEDGGPFTPWRRSNAHLHVENGRIESIHARGTLEQVTALLKACLTKEQQMLRHARDGNIEIDMPLLSPNL